MGRKAKVNFRGRRNLPNFIVALHAKPTSEWPSNLLNARRILLEECGLSPSRALDVILGSVSGANRCVREQNQRCGDISTAQVSFAIGKACERIAKCAKRAPAEARKALDNSVVPLVCVTGVDLEGFELVIGAATKTFQKCDDIEPRRTALSALSIMHNANLSSLSPIGLSRMEDALVKLAKRSKAKGDLTAIEIFFSLSTVLKSQSTKFNTHNNQQIAHYLDDLKGIWRKAGLTPSRSSSLLNAPNSRFHRFANLILTEVTGPLPAYSRYSDHVTDDQEVAGPLPAHSRYSDQVSDDHVRKALRRQIKISGRKTP